MKQSEKILTTVGIFGLLYGYTYFVFDTSLFYHFHQPVFLLNPAFLANYLLYPGGILDWISQFVFQFFIWNWLGALILTGLIGSIFLTVYHIIKQSGLNQIALLVSFIPIGFLLFHLNHYEAPLVISIRFLSAILLFSLYSRSCRLKPVFIFLSWPIYLFLGGYAFIFYCIMVVLHELQQLKNKMQFVYITIHLLAGWLYPFIALKFIYLITFREAYQYLYPIEYYYEPFRFKAGLAIKGLFFSLPVIFLCKLVITRFIIKKIKTKPPVNHSEKLIRYQVLLISLLSIGVLFLSRDTESKIKITVDRFANHRDWEQVLAYAQQLNDYDRQVNFQVNRALYYKGRLLTDMFRYPQVLGADGLFPYRFVMGQIAIPASDLLFDLAHISASRIMAYEGQTKQPYNPRILKRLFLTNLIDRDEPIAKKFTDILKMSLIYRPWARNAEYLLFNESRSDADSVISQKRALRPTRDFFFNRENPNVDMIMLLDQHPENRMAFEYLIAYYLLNSRIMNIVARLDQFTIYGYHTLPRHVEEAILLMKSIRPDAMKENQVLFRPETLKRFTEFNRLLLQAESDSEKARERLKKDFGDTYWYYLRYVDPRQTHITLSKRKINENY
jgi:hypothetical protein